MKLYIKSILIILSLLMIQLSAFAQTVVIGHVYDGADSTPVADAIVIIGKDTAITDSAGSFALVNRKKYKRLNIISNYYATQSVKLSKNNEYSLSIYLSSVGNKFVKDLKNDDRRVNINNTKATPNDTMKYIGVQGKFTAYFYDKESKQAIEGVVVLMKEMQDGAMSDSFGFVELLYDGPNQHLNIDALGYQTLDTLVSDMGQSEPLKIYLTQLDNELDGVVVYARKKKYRNKNNPAVALIRKVIDHKGQNRMLSKEDAQFEVYDKMVFYASNLPRFVYRNPFLKKFRFLFENEDTTILDRRRLMPLYISETVSDHYYRASDQKKGSQLKAEKRLRFSEEFVESNNITTFLDRLYDQVDIYDDQVRLLNNFFLSPIAPSAPNFYKFFIVDTSIIDNRQVVQLRFEPRNTNDFLFEGRLFVTLSPDYAVTKAKIWLPKKSPVNLTNSLKIDLNFEKQENGKYWQNSSMYLVNFGLYNSRRGAVGVRYTNKKNLTQPSSIHDSLFVVKQVGLEHKGDTAFQQTDDYWIENRPEQLSFFERRAYTNLDSAKGMPAYKNMMKAGYVIASGYYPYKKLEFGRIYDIISYNYLEGFKPRIGGQTNIKKIQNMLLQGYVAYGVNDKRFKYYLGGSIALNKYLFSFPQNYISMSYQYDTRSPGVPMGWSSQDSWLGLITRGDRQRYFYNKNFSISYTREFQNHMTLSLGFTQLQQEAAGSLYFERANGSNDTINNLSTSEINLFWRFSPRELFYQNKRFRTQADNGAWDIKLYATAGFNNGYSEKTINYQKFETRIDKRFFFAPYGNLKMIIRGGYLFGTVSYPYLFAPMANQTIRFSTESYNMMNYMEFAYDKYASITFDYHMKGFLLNRIPAVRQMYLREVFGFKVLYGGIRNENLPQYNSGLLQFPKDSKGNNIVNQFGKLPYIEASVGLENIVKVMRIDFVMRFTYKDLAFAPNPAYGLRYSFGVDF